MFLPNTDCKFFVVRKKVCKNIPNVEQVVEIMENAKNKFRITPIVEKFSQVYTHPKKYT